MPCGEEGSGDSSNPPRREQTQQQQQQGSLLMPSFRRRRRSHAVSSGLLAGPSQWPVIPLLVAFLLVATCRGRLEPVGDETNSHLRRDTAEVADDAGPGVQVAAAEAPDSRPRVAVCFFGLTRSLRWTLPSVQNRLLGVLEEGGMRVDVFVHTYSLVKVNNKRAEEMGVDYRSFVGDYKSLQPTRSLVTNQDDFDVIWPNPLSLTHYNWTYPQDLMGSVIRNVMRAYWSMSLVWGLMAEHAAEGDFEYDAVVLARPDVWFHYDVNITSDMFPLPERTVFVPSFDNDNLAATRRNDRFAYGSTAAMRVVMNRIATLLEPGAGKYGERIDSEWVFGHHLRKHGVSVRLLDLLVTRVRLTREIPKYDHRLVEEACQSGEDPLACTMVEAGFKFPADDGPL